MSITAEHTTEKAIILAALYKWINQRPGLEYGNYGDPVAYRRELRGIARDKREACTLLRAVELSMMTGEELLEGFRVFSGRLAWKGDRLECCTGQYWPIEYRKAVCAVAAAALWDYHREDFAATAKEGESAGDAIRRSFRRAFGRAIQSRWFD